MCSREAPAFTNKNVRSQRVKGQSVLWGRGFRTPCCVINNFLDSMYSPLSPFPKKAAVCMSAGCSAKKIQIKPQLLTMIHTHTHKIKLRQTHHIHIFSPLYGSLPLTKHRHPTLIYILSPEISDVKEYRCI